MIKAGFILLSLLMIVSPIVLFLKATDDKLKLIKRYIIIIFLWLVYVLGLSFSGVLLNFDLPPRIPLLIILPSILLSILLTGQPIFKRNLNQFSPNFPINVQAYRIAVELLILGAILYGYFPEGVSFDGTNYDILVGLTAPVIGVLFMRDKITRKWVLAWNIGALIILTFTGYSFVSTYYIHPEFSSDVSRELLTEFPFILLPGLLLPLAIFYHIVSIRQSIINKF
ncbi:hypothetical protein OO013_03930 [Mangrovivirga sp. M17]|uniref:Lycopene cyclase domain-containing protein n=1 Tax=Mangrovivirga halotolerans TaxID=2993936 RepID=A0ABT3RNA0_9BACT|nr:hypothetical protein [Mangrovivirga halotolerans]MCX2742998.1 hypothetical protein [Mangrovivirga halotolerans]